MRADGADAVVLLVAAAAVACRQSCCCAPALCANAAVSSRQRAYERAHCVGVAGGAFRYDVLK